MSIEQLGEVIRNINKKYGDKALRDGADFKVERISTGSLTLNNAIGGGWPIGRMVLLWGNKSSTKSTLSLWTIANAQKMGKKCLYIDSERTFESDWAEANGVDTKDLMVMRLNSMEDLLDTTHDILRNNLADVLVLDSVNAVNSVKYFEENNSAIGIHSRSMGEIMSKWNAWNQNTLIMMVSQQRTKFAGHMAMASYSGGNAIEHYSSVIVKFFSMGGKDSIRMGSIQNGNKIYEKPVARRVHWNVEKSKISIPHVDGYYYYFTDGGIDRIEEIFDEGVRLGIIGMGGGGMYYYEDLKIKGKDSFKELLGEDVDMCDKIEKRIVEEML